MSGRDSPDSAFLSRCACGSCPSHGGGVSGGHEPTLAPPSMVEDDDPPYQTQPTDGDVAAMAALYLALAEGTRAGISAFAAPGGSAEKARSAAVQTLVQVATARGAAPLLATVSGERPIQVDLWADDGAGGVSADPPRGERVLKVLKISVVGLRRAPWAPAGPASCSLRPLTHERATIATPQQRTLLCAEPHIYPLIPPPVHSAFLRP